MTSKMPCVRVQAGGIIKPMQSPPCLAPRAVTVWARSALALLLAVQCCLPLSASAAAAPPDTDSTDRLIIKWRSDVNSANSAQFDDEIKQTGRKTGNTVRGHRSLGGKLHVLQLDQTQQGAELAQTLAQWRADPRVAFAEPDRRIHSHTFTPNDPLYTAQWYLQSQQAAATRTHVAWDNSTGGSNVASSVIVAVIDSGVRFDHPDLRRAAAGGKLLPGYDFVSGDKGNVFLTANDGDGWDADPSDPGDFLTAADLSSSTYSGKKCGAGTNKDQPTRSSWHGTRVAGLIGADTNNAQGIAGAAYNVRILPLRALGKCGGYDSDVIAAMYWAAGLSIPVPLLQGAPPVNATPAQVINMSLGGLGTCTATYSQAVNDITAKGVLIVASAGNEGGPVDIPANCPGVLSVAGLRHVGTKVGYSNLGPEVGIAAPAGNCVNTGVSEPCLFSLDTTTDSGSQGPVGPDYTNTYNYNVGTSFSAPLAAAAVALMRAVNPSLTPKQLIARVQASARAFPVNSDASSTLVACHTPAGSSDVQNSECLCTTSVCGAGLLDTGAAVALALKPSAVAGYSGVVATGRLLTVDGSASGVALGRSPASYRWTVVATTGGAATPAFANPTSAVTTVLSPSTGSYTVRLTVTDSAGATDTADITVQAIDSGGVVTPTTPPSSGGSGGGGSVLPPALLGLTVLTALRRRLTHPRRSTRA